MADAVMSGRLILASASPRRIELLNLMGLQFDVMPGDVDESFTNGETPREHVLRLSGEKAGKISDQYPDAWVMGADTIVIINGEVLGKPRTADEAREMLGKLSGRTHTVFTGFTVMKKSAGIAIREAVDSSVRFRDIREDEMLWYIESEEPYDKAGGYAVQGMGAFFIREICGSYTNVMGLPLCEVVDVLKRLGVLTFAGDDHAVDRGA
jgi:septum formation protein